MRPRCAALADLTSAGYDRAVALAGLPQSIRGYEEIKLESVRGYMSARNELLADLCRSDAHVGGAVEILRT